MADTITGNAELGATKMDLIASVVQRSLEASTNLRPTVTDVSRFAQPGLKSIEFPKLTDFSVINRVSAAAGDATALTAANDTLNLDFNAYVAWIVDSSDELQSRIAVQAENAARAAAAHGRYVDLQVINKMDSVSSLNVNGGAPADITRDDILAMREHILDSGGDLSRMWLALPPGQETALLKLAEFSQADIYGRAVIPSGFIGTVYGVSLLVNRQIEAQQAYMYDSEGIYIGFQSQPNMSSQPANEYGSRAERHALDQLFGVMGSQLGKQGAGATQSPLVAKLKD